VNRLNGVFLYRTKCTDVHKGQDVLLRFASAELGRDVTDKDLRWTRDQEGSG
jgi:hypothetical protein